MINESLKNAFKEMWKKNLDLLDISKTDLNLHIHDDNPHHITPYMIGAADSDHTHLYAGSSSAGGSANSAVKLDSSAGSATQPIYFSNGKPAACTYTLGKSVPSNAKFTDTTYNNATTSTDGLMSSSDKTKLNGIAAGATKTTVDSALSSTSTNPVQNKVIYGAISSKADLDTSGKVLSSQLPSYVDDVLEYSAKSNFPSTGESGKIYVDTATNLTYRWSGSAYVEISQSLALGETSSTAYRGDRGKIAYDHSQTSHAPSNAEVNQNAFSNVKVGSTTVSADSKTDTLELVAGTNVTLTPDATNDKVIIAAKDTTYGVATSSELGLIKSGTDITVDSSGNVSVNDDSHNHIISNIDGLQSVLDEKLSKTTYEYNKELALGSSGKVCIGVFPCYDSNISVEIKSTTNITYNGTLIIATQNINTSLGGTYTATVYGDENNTLTSAIKIQYLSGSNAFSVYINLPPWSKNLLHIQCVSLAGTPSSIATIVDTIPSTATIIPTNAFSHTHNYAGSSSVGGSATSAVKLDTTAAGDANTPVYFSGGKPVACTSLDLDTSGNAATATALKNSGTLDTQAKIDGFIAGDALKYATFKTTDSNNVNMASNDGMIISVPWTSSSYGAQLAFDDAQDATMKIRGYSGGWGDWKTLLNSSNYTDYAAASSHTHSASNITSGTLGVARGGTGATTAEAARSNLGLSGAQTKTLLWQNASSTSSFPPQEIPGLDASDYDTIEIITRTHKTDAAERIDRVVKGATCCIAFVWNVRHVRAIHFGIDGKVNVKVGNKSSSVTASVSNDNQAVIPLKIYGIKEV